MIDPPDALRERLMETIAEHLRRSPKAADTPKGIAEWWLRGSGADAAPGDVHAALDALIGRGVVERAVLADGTEIFRAAQRAPAAKA